MKKFEVYEEIKTTRRIIIEANSISEAKNMWELGEGEVDEYYSGDIDDYELIEINEISEEDN